MADTQNTPMIPFAQRQFGSEQIDSIDARDLHSFLGIVKEYSTWIKTWIRKAHLIQHRDYEVFSLEGRNPQGGRPSLEYSLSFDAAKCIGMMSGSRKGDEVREWFLECERRVLSAQTLPILHDPAYQMLMKAVIDLDETRHQLALVEKQARSANTKSDLALAQQLWTTIREYRYLHKLEHQMPMSDCKAFGKYLTGHCLEQGIPVRDQGVADKIWGREHAYHVEVISQLLPNWLKRHSGQISLVPHR